MQTARRYAIRHLHAIYGLQQPIWAQPEPERVDKPRSDLLWLKRVNEHSLGLEKSQDWEKYKKGTQF